MAIEVVCGSCQRSMMLKDSCAGKKGLCPNCKAPLIVPEASAPVPAEPAEEFVAPTERQIAFAQKLGIAIPSGTSRKQLSAMIDVAKESAPATESQKEFLRDLGVKFPADIKSNQISMLLDAATDIRNQISAGLHKQYAEAGMLIEGASDEDLLYELSNRGKDFFAFILDDDEFRYQENRPMKGQLRWSDSLNKTDVQYILASMAVGWAKDLDMNAYSDEFDGSPPELEFTANELTYKGKVVHLSLNPFGND